MIKLPPSKKPLRTQIGDKLQIWQNLMLPIDGKLTRKKVSDWIKEDPEKIFFHVYEYKLHGLTQVKLSQESAVALKKVLKVKHPTLYKIILDRREKHMEIARNSHKKKKDIRGSQ